MNFIAMITRVTLFTGALVFAGTFSQAQSAKEWTQIATGIESLKKGETEHEHHTCGRMTEAAWRRDDRQSRHILWMGTTYGGLWKSNFNSDGNLASWKPLTDNFPGPHRMGSFLVNRTNS